MMRQITTPAGDDATWKQAVPLWGVVYGRIGLGILEAVALGLVVATWSALAHTGLDSNQVTGFAILATAVREVLDASSMRLTMRILRTNDMNAIQRTVAAIICPAIGGALGAMAFAPHSLTQLTLVTWALFMLIACTLEQPWKTPMSYEEMKERGRRTRMMTREHFAEEIDGRMTFRPIDDEGYLLDEDGNRIETDRSTNQ